jgi:hypothetical protein
MYAFLTFLPGNFSSCRRSSLDEATSASTKTFLTALVLNGVIAAVEITVFTVVRRYFRLIYEPRSLSVFEACAFPLALLCLGPHSHLGSDSSLCPLIYLDGLFLCLTQTIAGLRIPMDWTATSLSVSCA